jgi:hypothetical protein
MAKKSAGKILSDSELAVATAEKVFGWKKVHKHDGELIGQKQDKIGRWRKAKVPSYSSDPGSVVGARQFNRTAYDKRTGRDAARKAVVQAARSDAALPCSG